MCQAGQRCMERIKRAAIESSGLPEDCVSIAYDLLEINIPWHEEASGSQNTSAIVAHG